MAAVAPRRLRLDRQRVVGGFFVVGGFLLVFAVAPALTTESKRFLFGIGPDAPSWTFVPSTATLWIGGALVLLGAAAVGWRGRIVQAGLVVAGVLSVLMILVAALALSSNRSTNLAPLFVQSLRLGSPIALGALAGLWSERSGVVNIGIEGMMLAGAGIGFVAYALMNGGAGGVPLYLAVLVAVVAGGLFAALHAFLSITLRTDQIVSGVAVNLLAIGLTSFLRSQILVPLNADSATTLPELSIPILSDLPVVGGVFTAKPIFFFTFFAFAVAAFVLVRTRWGLRVRAVGENPHAAETLGIDVIRVRYGAVILGGCIAGLAGAQFSLETVGSFDDLMTNGTGFIALAALIFGKWRPGPVLAGAMFFGFARALGVRIQLLGVEIAGFPLPSQFLQAVPYVVTIVVLAGAIGRAVPPAAIGKPYRRSR
ncbi:MAG TPA: ABC transporter permease [Actinobacteria bacterium]|nr:ABC transporter permease [Actinomycetota bacterium]